MWNDSNTQNDEQNIMLKSHCNIGKNKSLQCIEQDILWYLGNLTLNIQHVAVTFFFVTARWCVLDNIHHLAVLTQFCYSARWCVLDNIHHLAVLT